MQKALITVLLTATASAAQAQTGPLDQVVEQMREVSSTMSSRMTGMALGLLYSLFLIELVWSLGKAMLKGEGIASVMTVFVTRLVTVGFFAFIIQGGDYWVGLAVNSARVIGETSPTAVAISPDAMLQSGLQLIGDLIASLSAFEVGRSIGAIFVALAIGITTAVSIAVLIVAYGELYIMAISTMIALAFGSLEVSRDVAKNYVMMIIGKALKLLTVLVVAGIVQTVVNNAIQGQGDLLAMMQVLMIQIIGLVMMMQLPSAAESLTGVGGNSAVTAIAGGAAAFAASKAAKTAIRTGSGATYGAARSAATSAGQSAGQRAAGVAGGALRGGAEGAMGNGLTAQARNDMLEIIRKARSKS